MALLIKSFVYRSAIYMFVLSNCYSIFASDVSLLQIAKTVQWARNAISVLSSNVQLAFYCRSYLVVGLKAIMSTLAPLVACFGLIHVGLRPF